MIAAALAVVAVVLAGVAVFTARFAVAVCRVLATVDDVEFGTPDPADLVLAVAGNIVEAEFARISHPSNPERS